MPCISVSQNVKTREGTTNFAESFFPKMLLLDIFDQAGNFAGRLDWLGSGTQPDY